MKNDTTKDERWMSKVKFSDGKKASRRQQKRGVLQKTVPPGWNLYITSFLHDSFSRFALRCVVGSRPPSKETFSLTCFTCWRPARNLNCLPRLALYHSLGIAYILGVDFLGRTRPQGQGEAHGSWVHHRMGKGVVWVNG
jgi:hypothetical protein